MIASLLFLSFTHYTDENLQCLCVTYKRRSLWTVYDEEKKNLASRTDFPIAFPKRAHSFFLLPSPFPGQMSTTFLMAMNKRNNDFRLINVVPVAAGYHEKRDVVLYHVDVVRMTLGIVGTACEQVLYVHRLSDGASSINGLCKGDIIVSVGNLRATDKKQTIEKVNNVLEQAGVVQLCVRSPSALDHPWRWPIKHSLVKKFLGDYTFGIQTASDGHNFTWTGVRGAFTMRALLFCRNCSAIYWERGITLGQMCPSCQYKFTPLPIKANNEDDDDELCGLTAIFHEAPNC